MAKKTVKAKVDAFGRPLSDDKPDLSGAPVRKIRFNASPPYGSCAVYSRGDVVSVREGGEAWSWTGIYYDYKADNKNDDRKPVPYAEVISQAAIDKLSEDQRAKQEAALMGSDPILS